MVSISYTKQHPVDNQVCPMFQYYFNIYIVTHHCNHFLTSVYLRFLQDVIQHKQPVNFEYCPQTIGIMKYACITEWSSLLDRSPMLCESDCTRS